MKIVDARDTRAINRLLTPRRGDDRLFERRVQTIVDAVRRGGDAALERFARRFDHSSPPLEVSPDDMRREALKADPAVRRAIKKAASHIARVAACRSNSASSRWTAWAATFPGDVFRCPRLS
jgi:histidinol dehydrogenase